jgi:hypothetical protein
MPFDSISAIAFQMPATELMEITFVVMMSLACMMLSFAILGIRHVC